MKNNALDLTLAKLNKDYGEGTVIKIGDAERNKKIDVIKSGSLGLDIALGVNGYPTGRIVEIYGPESSGKTTLCLHAVAEAQKIGKKAAIIDMEHSLDLNYAESLGVNVNDLVFSQPSYGEEALNIAKELASTGEIGIIIIDSIAALVPKSEADGDIGDSNVGKQARMISQAMRILTPIFEENNVLVIFTNQLRMKIGIMFGSPETTAGGEAMKYFASIRIDVRKTILKESDEAIGNHMKATIKKNKVSPPYKVAEFDINFGKGIDRDKELLELSVETNIIKKSGSWYSYEENKLGQGIDGVIELFKSNPEFKAEIESKLLTKIYGEESSIIS